MSAFLLNGRASELLLGLSRPKVLANSVLPKRPDQDRGAQVVAEVYYASDFDSCISVFDATDVNGVTHWCYAFARYENEGSYPGNHFVMHSACLLIIKRWMHEEEKSIQNLYDAALCIQFAELQRGVLTKSALWRRTVLGAILDGQAGMGGE